MQKTLIYALWIIFITLVSLFGQWQQIGPGLQWAEFEVTTTHPAVKGKISVLKINPDYYEFDLLSASEHGDKCRTVREWCEDFGLIAAINAGMYQQDFLKNVGYMKNFDHVNNPAFRKDFFFINLPS